MFKTYKDAVAFIKRLGYRQYNNVAWTGLDDMSVARVQRTSAGFVVTYVEFCENALKETG